MKTLKYLIILFFASTLLYSCDDLLDVDNDNRYIGKDDNNLSNANDSVYSVLGLLSEMQKLSTQYIVLGELQGDLLDVTDYSDRYLREISEHNISSKNPYVDVTQFYKVINNCNYVIEHMDTLVSKGALLPDYAAAVKIRAWTYLQLVKNFSHVRYGEKAIENVDDALDPDFYPEMSREDIMDKLITQLIAIKHVPAPLRYVDKVHMRFMIPTADFLLGELYLWRGDYFNAATHYKNIMEQNWYYSDSGSEVFGYYICDKSIYNIKYLSSGIREANWEVIFYATESNISASNLYEVPVGMYYHPKYGNENTLAKLLGAEYKMKPSSAAIDYWVGQSTSVEVQGYRYGDYRGLSSWTMGGAIKNSKAAEANSPHVRKFNTDTIADMVSRVILERASTIHLRYAEAVNRLGKPTLALAALNNGVKKSVVNDPSIVNPGEIADSSFIVTFDHALYNNSGGVRGRVDLKPIVIPSSITTTQDSMLYVEEMILKEAALENAFEGNRWSDLVRIALRRYDTEPNFLPEILKAKFTYNSEGLIPTPPSASWGDVSGRFNSKDDFFIPLSKVK